MVMSTWFRRIRRAGRMIRSTGGEEWQDLMVRGFRGHEGSSACQIFGDEAMVETGPGSGEDYSDFSLPDER